MTDPNVGSVWLTDSGYVKVVAVQKGSAYVRPCTVNGYVRGRPPAILTNLAWFEVWSRTAT